MRVISSCVPGDRHVGELLLAAMLKQVPDRKFDFCAITSDQGGTVENSCQWRVDYVEPPLELSHPEDAGVVMSSVNSIRRLWAYERFARRVAGRVSSLLSQQDAEPVWIIADSTAVIDCVYYAFLRKPFRFRLQIWDDVRHLASLKHLDPVSTHRVFKRFRFLLTQAVGVAVIGEQMAAEYVSLGARNCHIIRHGLNIDGTVPFAPPCTKSFRIGFCGSMYAGTAWKAFQEALYAKEWKLGGRIVQMIIASPAIELTSGKPADVRFYGWQTPENTARMMAECDLLYMPQGFDPEQRYISGLSFPTKLSTYVHTGRAVFVHTPEYGSLTKFCKSHGFGLLCNVLAPKQIADMLECLVSDPVQLALLAESTQRIARDVLSPTRFEAQVRVFFSSQHDDL
jgi:hypothetical protein